MGKLKNNFLDGYRSYKVQNLKQRIEKDKIELEIIEHCDDSGLTNKLVFDGVKFLAVTAAPLVMGKLIKGKK